MSTRRPYSWRTNQAVPRSRNQWWFGSSGVNSSSSSQGSEVRVWVTRRRGSSELQAGHRAVRTDRPGSGRSRTKAKKAGRVVYGWSIGPPPFGRGSGVSRRASVIHRFSLGSESPWLEPWICVPLESREPAPQALSLFLISGGIRLCCKSVHHGKQPTWRTCREDSF